MNLLELIEFLIREGYPIEWRQSMDGIRYLGTTRRYFRWLSVFKRKRSYRLIDILADIPEDVVTSDQQLPQFQFPQHLFNECPKNLKGDYDNQLSYASVRLMSARSPHEFYLNLCGADFHDAYHRLRIEMRIYDNKGSAQKYMIPGLLWFEGYLCAVKYPKVCDEWHRGRIISIDKQNKCRLFLVDVGDIVEANARDLCLLQKKFAELPAQALRAQLHGISPIPYPQSDRDWTHWAKRIVQKLADYKYCNQIECAFIDNKNEMYRVYIKYYDKHMSSNINDLISLHQVLIEKQLATISGDDDPLD